MTDLLTPDPRGTDGLLRGVAPCHFGEWLQGRLGPEGELILVTLLCSERSVQVTCSPRATRPGAVGSDESMTEVARAFLDDLGLGSLGEMTLDMPFRPGAGTGMSTAALVALARAMGPSNLPEADLSAACLRQEGATDPLMLRQPDAVLWAPRRAVMLEELPPPPRVEVLGAFWGPPEPTCPADVAFADVSDLVAAWRAGPSLEDACRLATLSAERCQAMRGPDSDPSAALAKDLGALGYARAHTGSARAFLFAPGTCPHTGAARLMEAGYDAPITFTTGQRR